MAYKPSNDLVINGAIYAPSYDLVIEGYAPLFIQKSEIQPGVITPQLPSISYGNAVSVSRNGLVLAIGAKRFAPQINKGNGVVFIYDLVNNAWVQRGSELYPDPINDPFYSTQQNYNDFGASVSLSEDGTYLLVGCADSGSGDFVRVYEWNGSIWTIRYDIISVLADKTAGSAASISGNGSILAISTVFNGTGSVKIFDWDGVDYNLRGTPILPPSASSFDGFGRGVALSSNGSVLAIASRTYNGVFASQGGIHFYRWDGASWSTDEILTANYYPKSNNFASSVALNTDATVLLAGMSGAGSGALVIFDKVPGGWNRRGTKFLDSDAGGQGFGESCAISGDALRIVAGGPDVTLPGNSYEGFVYDFIPGNLIESINKRVYDSPGLLLNTLRQWDIDAFVIDNNIRSWDVSDLAILSNSRVWGIDTGADILRNWSDSVTANNVRSWNITGVEQSDFQRNWDLTFALDNDFQRLWAIDTGAGISRLWASDVIADISRVWEIAETIGIDVSRAWDLTTALSNNFGRLWDVIDYNISEQHITRTFDIDPTLPTLIINTDTSIIIDHLNRKIQHGNITINRDISSWPQSFSSKILDINDWILLQDEPEITLTIGDYSWSFIAESVSKNNTIGSQTLSVKGRSKTIKLSAGFANKNNEKWPVSTAKTIVQGLCDYAGVVLDWQIHDWPLTNYSGNDRYPIDIIIELAQATGAVVQSSNNSVLQIMPSYKVAPNKYSLAVPDAMLNSNDDEISASQRKIKRQDYDHIEVGNETAGSDNELSISLESETTDSGLIIRAFVVPFKVISLKDSAGAKVSLLYRGIKTGQIVDTIEIVDGRGSLSKPFYKLLKTKWLYDSEGSLNIDESGSISASIGGTSLVEITYLTKWVEFSAYSSEEKAQVYIEA